MSSPEPAITSTAGAADLLWTDTTIFQRRHEKSVRALVAVRQSIEERGLDGAEREFLGLCERLFSADADVFTQVWTDPTAYWWVRSAYQLAATELAGEELTSFAKAHCRDRGDLSPRETFVRHLADLKRFVLAQCYLAGEDIEFETPLRVNLPFAIPATRLSLVGGGAAEIAGLRGGALQLAAAGTLRSVSLRAGTPGASEVEECPVASHAGFDLLLQPHALHNLPGIDLVAPALKTDLDFQRRNRRFASEILGRVAHFHPDCFAQFRDVMKIAVFKGDRGQSYNSSSHSDVPGVLIATAFGTADEIGDTFVHEFFHNRLFFIEERGSFFDESKQDALEDEYIYHPWRNDPRPIHGVLHAVYVAIGVFEFWRNAVQSGELDGADLDYARQSALREGLRLGIGVHQLGRHGKFSEFGRVLFDAMRAKVDRLHEALGDSALPDDAPATELETDGTMKPRLGKISGKPQSVREYLREHLEESAPADQRADIARHVRLG